MNIKHVRRRIAKRIENLLGLISNIDLREFNSEVLMSSFIVLDDKEFWIDFHVVDKKLVPLSEFIWGLELAFHSGFLYGSKEYEE